MSLTTVNVIAATLPNRTVLIPVKPLPFKVIKTPTAADAGDGEPVILGARVAATLNVGVGVVEGVGVGVAEGTAVTFAVLVARVTKIV